MCVLAVQSSAGHDSDNDSDTWLVADLLFMIFYLQFVPVISDDYLR